MDSNEKKLKAFEIFKNKFNMEEYSLKDYLNGLPKVDVETVYSEIQKELDEFGDIDENEIEEFYVEFWNTILDKDENGILSEKDSKELENFFKEHKEDEELLDISIELLSENKTKLEDSTVKNLLKITDENMAEYKKRYIIVLSKSDELKKEKISDMSDEYDKVVIISSLSNDEEKIGLLDSISDECNKAVIISSLSNDEEKIGLLDSISDEKNKAEIIFSLSNDEGKIGLLDSMSDEYNKFIIINSLSNDDKKIEQLKRISDEKNKAVIISSLSNDDKKIEQLKRISDEKNKAVIISSLSNYDKKIEQLKTISGEKNKAVIIKSISNDDKKIEQLKTISDENTKVEIILSLSDDKKIEQLKTISDEKNKAEIISSLSNDDGKIGLLDSISDEKNKSIIIFSLSNDDKKIEQLEKITDEASKIKIILSLKDEETKLKKLINEGKKIKSSIEQFDSEKIEEYKKFNLPDEMTIGMEIESEGKFSNLLNNQLFYGWNAKGDGSLREGVEIVSPILRSNQEDEKEVYAICNLLNAMGNSCSERCGGHVHIGAEYLQSKDAYANLLSIYGNAEEILYIICNDPKDVNARGTGYAQPLSKKLSNAIESDTINLESEESIEEFIKDLQKVQGERYSGLNFRSYDAHKTIEFRLANGTINPDSWIENVNLFGGIVKTAEEIQEIKAKSLEEITPEEQQKLNDFEKLQSIQRLTDKGQNEEQIKKQNEEKLELLLRLTIREEDRDIYRNRYKENIELLSDKQKEEYRNGTTDKPIKVKKAGKISLTGAEKATIEEIEEAEKVNRSEILTKSQNLQKNQEVK